MEASYSKLSIIDILHTWDGSGPRSGSGRSVDLLRNDLIAFARLQSDLDNYAWSILSIEFKRARIRHLKNQIAWVKERYEQGNQENHDLIELYRSYQDTPLWIQCSAEIDLLLSKKSRQMQFIDEQNENLKIIYKPLSSWLQSDRWFSEAADIFEKKKCSRRLPKSTEIDDIRSPLRALTAVAANGLLRRFKPYQAAKKKKISPKLVSLAKKFIAELENEGIDDTGFRKIKKIAVGAEDFFRINTGHDEIRRDVVKRIGLSFSESFIFDSANKGRPYPDVVDRLLRLTGLEMSERHINRTLRDHDWIALLPDMPQWILSFHVMTMEDEMRKARS